MRFLKIFLLIATVIINVHISNNAFGYAQRNPVVDYTTCATKTTRTACNELVGCAWTSSSSNGNHCKRGDCQGAGTNCEERAGCYHPIATACYPCEEGNYCEYGTAKQVPCSTGNYCPEGSAYPYPCPAGSYCPEPTSMNPCEPNCYCPEGSSASRSCSSPYLYSASGSDAINDCHTNGGKEYSISTNTVVDCNKGRDSFGYCPTGTYMYYGRQYADRYGWTPCTTNGQNKRDIRANIGAKTEAECYVVCPTESISNGTKHEHNIYATASSNGTYNYPACNYSSHITCNTGYELNSSKNGCNAKTTTVSFDKDGGSGGDVYVTATYDADMPKITPPTRTGFTFNGYYYQSIKYYDTNGNSVRKWNQTTGNITLTASWTANTYNITYDTNDGAFSAEATNHPATAQYDQMFYVDHPTRKNYEFAGWIITDMSDGIKHYYGDYNTTSNNIDKTTETAYKNLHHQSGATVRFTAQWSGKYYKVTLNDTCPSGADKKKDVSPKTIYEKYNTGWYLTNQQGGDTFSQLTDLPVCNKYKFTGFCKGTCSDTNNRVINAIGAKTGNMTNTMFSDDDTGTRQLTAHYVQCTCLLGTGAQSCSNTETTGQNKCVFSIGCETGYSKDGTQTGSTNFGEAVDVHQFEATCQPITYAFKIELDGGSGGTLPSGNINVTYADGLPDLTNYSVPCKSGHIITGLKDSAGTLYYTYDSSNKKLTAVTGKTWDKTESTTILTVAWDACSGGKYCECTNKPNEKQNCPALFTSDAPADAKTDCYMTGKINLSDKFGSKELDLGSSKLYLQQ